MTGVSIIGVGLHPFGRSEGVSGRAQGMVAARRALADAGISFRDIQFAAGGSYDGGTADALVNDLGLTSIPFMNVFNGCATGGSSLTAATSAILSGRADIALAVGFDKHPRGAFNSDPEEFGLPQWYGHTGMMLTTQFFAMKIQRYLHEHELSPELLGHVAAKAYANGALSGAWRHQAMTAEEINAAPMVSHPLTQYMFCSPGEGGAAVVLCRDDLASKYAQKPIRLRAVTLRSRHYGSFEVFTTSMPPEVAESVTTAAATAAFEEAGISPSDVDVAQLQDTEAGAEVMHMAETGLCGHGDQAKLILDGQTEIGGSLPVNTDGGLIANGEPVGASALRQVTEIVNQLRGSAGARQVPGSPKVGFTHVYGAPGVSSCSVLTL